MAILVNIDNGGTFTDVCISDGSRVVYAKSPTTAHDLTQCFVDVLNRGARELYGEADIGRLVREAECLRYSTTAGTNAVIEHKGTPVAMLVEAGEETTVYGARERLSDSPLWQAMVPIPPAGIAVAADGSINSDELTSVVNALLSKGALRLVVALRSKQAEQNVKDELLERYPRHLLGAIPFLISSELVEDADDARRTVTTVINSYLHPGMEHFLYGAETVCKEKHLRRPLLIYRNDGNSARVAKTTAIKTWGSGPRGGLEGAIAYAECYEKDTVVAMDIGGTTTDISLVLDRQAQMMPYADIGGVATSLPMPNLHSFGLGGSSVVRVSGGEIAIGPDSVGASPGPACFARGGTDATLTDALLVCGLLDPNNYLGGELRLDPERAQQAIDTAVGEPLGLATGAAAVAVVTAFESACGANIVKSITASGREPATSCLVAFGGGGPMIITGIAAAAGIRSIIIPRFASVFSAFGIGFSHLAHAYQVPLNGGDPDQLSADLRARAERDMYGEGVAPDECQYAFSLWGTRDGRVVEAPLAQLPKFKSTVEALRLALTATNALPTSSLITDDEARSGAAKTTAMAEVVMSDAGADTIPLYDGTALAAGETLDGPALIRGAYLTCFIRSGWSLRVSKNLDLVLEAQ